MTQRITPAVLAAQRSQHPPDLVGAQASLDQIEAEHVRGTAASLIERPQILAQAVRDRSSLVLGATYRLADGRVRLVSKEG